jgi:Ca2+-binding EF-hand superfamily protein
MEITMWEKIKKWFGLLDLNKDGKVTAEDLEVARALADKNAKAANEALNEVAEAAAAVKKVVKGVKKK